MSSRFRISAGLLALLLLSCKREERQDEPPPEQKLAALGPRFEGNANQMARGQALFSWMNCSGCHSHGGGGMGPALTDSDWRYGGSMKDIVTTILDGRPNGMPAFRGRITEDQAWQLAAYVRSLSGQPSKDVVSSRADGISGEPWDLARKQPVRGNAEYAATRPKQ